MPFDFSPSHSQRKNLRRRDTLVLDEAAGTIIAVDRGCLWLTLEHDPRDIVLTPGMHFEIDRNGRTVVAAEEDSRLRLVRAPTLGERSTAWLSRLVTNAVREWSRRLERQRVPYF